MIYETLMDAVTDLTFAMVDNKAVVHEYKTEKDGKMLNSTLVVFPDGRGYKIRRADFNNAVKYMYETYGRKFDSYPSSITLLDGTTVETRKVEILKEEN